MNVVIRILRGWGILIVMLLCMGSVTGPPIVGSLLLTSVPWLGIAIVTTWFVALLTIMAFFIGGVP